jgi:hypothetical protein
MTVARRDRRRRLETAASAEDRREQPNELTDGSGPSAASYDRRIRQRINEWLTELLPAAILPPRLESRVRTLRRRMCGKCASLKPIGAPRITRRALPTTEKGEGFLQKICPGGCGRRSKPVSTRAVPRLARGTRRRPRSGIRKNQNVLSRVGGRALPMSWLGQPSATIVFATHAFSSERPHPVSLVVPRIDSADRTNPEIAHRSETAAVFTWAYSGPAPSHTS